MKLLIALAIVYGIGIIIYSLVIFNPALAVCLFFGLIALFILFLNDFKLKAAKNGLILLAISAIGMVAAYYGFKHIAGQPPLAALFLTIIMFLISAYIKYLVSGVYELNRRNNTLKTFKKRCIYLISYSAATAIVISACFLLPDFYLGDTSINNTIRHYVILIFVTTIAIICAVCQNKILYQKELDKSRSINAREKMGVCTLLYFGSNSRLSPPETMDKYFEMAETIDKELVYIFGEDWREKILSVNTPGSCLYRTSDIASFNYYCENPYSSPHSFSCVEQLVYAVWLSKQGYIDRVFLERGFKPYIQNYLGDRKYDDNSDRDIEEIKCIATRAANTIFKNLHENYPDM